MKRILTILIFLSVSLLSFGQSDTTDFKIIIRGEPLYTEYPTLILKIDTVNVKLDSISIKKLNPNWVKRIEVVKSEKFQHIYGNTDGVVFIYPKKNKRKKLIELYNNEIK